jgi:hypothetical protein
MDRDGHEIPVFHVTRGFISVFISVRRWTPSKLLQSVLKLTPYLNKNHFNIIPPSTNRSPRILNLGAK